MKTLKSIPKNIKINLTANVLNAEIIKDSNYRTSNFYIKFDKLFKRKDDNTWGSIAIYNIWFNKAYKIRFKLKTNTAQEALRR